VHSSDHYDAQPFRQPDRQKAALFAVRLRPTLGIAILHRPVGKIGVSVFLKIFRKEKVLVVPNGYPSYTAKDFEERLKVVPEQSVQMAKDYLSLVQFDETNEFGRLVFGSGRDLHSLAQAVAARYKLEKKQAAAVSRFFANIATTRKEQVRKRDLGISKCIWMATTCGLRKNDPNASHALLSGQQFDADLGLRTEEGYLLPGVSIDCTCIAKSIIPGLEG
jgi:hypothetical protein